MRKFVKYILFLVVMFCISGFIMIVYADSNQSMTEESVSAYENIDVKYENLNNRILALESRGIDEKYWITTGIAMLSLIFSVFLGVKNYNNNKFEMKNEYFRMINSKEMIIARHVVRTSDKLTFQDIYVPEILNFYEYWGMMAKQRHLPLSVFNSASGITALQIYEKLKPLIEQERKKEMDGMPAIMNGFIIRLRKNIKIFYND